MVKEEPEIFGLPLLDTITCGLGGAIILLTIVMSQIRPPNDSTLAETEQERRQTQDNGDDMGDPAIVEERGFLQVMLAFDNMEKAHNASIYSYTLKEIEGSSTHPILRGDTFFSWYNFEFDASVLNTNFDFTVNSDTAYKFGCVSVVTPMQGITKTLESEPNQTITFERDRNRWISEALGGDCSF